TLAPATPGDGGAPRGSISAALNGSPPCPCRRAEHRPSWACVVDRGRGYCRTDVHTGRPPLGNTVLVRVDRPQGWVHGGAHLLRDRTTRSKHTSRRWICGVGRIPGQSLRRQPRGGVTDPGEGRAERTRVGVSGLVHHLSGGSLLHDPARVHDTHAITGGREHGQVVADHEQDRKSTRLNSSHVSISYAV